MERSGQNKCREPFESLYKLNLGLSLSGSEAEEAMNNIFKERNAKKRNSLMTTLLTGIMIKGPTIEEVHGLLAASLNLDDTLNKKIKVPCNDLIIGVASSGKKGIKTINITSAACFVAAACGVKIAKACSHSTSSKTGSSDFLEICGININIPFDRKINILNKHNIAFFSIEETTPKFAQLYGGVFYIPHSMSFGLAGLSFPIEIDALAYGLSHPNVKLSAEVLKTFGVKNSITYSSTLDEVHYLDEVLPIGRILSARIKDGHVENTNCMDIENILNIDMKFDINSITERQDKVANIMESIKALHGDGDESQINVICVNAAIFLFLAHKVLSLKDGYELAKKQIKNKSAWSLFIDVLKGYGGDEKRVRRLLRKYQCNRKKVN